MSGKPEDLFYAAFELRCCIETRQADYLEAVEWYQGQKVKPWQMGIVSKKLRRLWRHPKIASLTYEFEDKAFPTFYTPVSAKLVRAGEKILGALLHSQQHFRKSDDTWWRSTREKLHEIYREAWIACRGEHMAPPLWDRDTGKTHPAKMYTSTENAELIVRLLRANGSGSFVLHVDYLDVPPDDWVCDLEKFVTCATL